MRLTLAGRTTNIRALQRDAMPAILCFEENYEETAEALVRIRASLVEGEANHRAGRKFSILPQYADFTTIKRCSPSAALVLAAEFDKSKAVREWNIPLIDLHRWDRRLKAMLDEIGFFKLLEIHRPTRSARTTSVATLQFQSGRQVGREEVAGLTDTMKAMLALAHPQFGWDEEFESTLMQLLSAIQEATENSCDHAYKDSDVPAVNQRWWATGAIDVSTRHLNLIAYDAGHSIPATLPTWDKYPFVASRLARFERLIRTALGEDQQDAIKMRLAMDAPRSSTDHAHRGHGFALFRQVVQQGKDAQLRIVSRNGEFLYRNGARPRTRALKTPLSGTLVEWDLWL